MVEDASGATAKPPMQGPVTPWLNPDVGRPGTGRAGASLRAEAARVHSLRRAERGRWWSSSPKRGVVAGSVTVPMLAAIALATGHPVVWVLAGLQGIGTAVLARSVMREWRADSTVRDLVREAAMEERLGAVLDRLSPYGWTVLHDRLLCGTGHRLAHVAVGPAGVVLVRPFHITGQVVVESGSLMVGGLPYDAWTDTRVWESAQLAYGAAAMLPEGWLVVATQHAVGMGADLPAGLRSWNRVGLYSVAQINHALLSAPRTLHREAAAYLAAVVDELCPPAPS